MTTAAHGRTALVTGATGFVGGRLARRLRADGWAVHIVTRTTSDAGTVAALAAAGCRVHVHDGTIESMAEIAGVAEPECTWHLATRFIGHHAPGDVSAMIRDNIEFGALLLEALAGTRHPAVVTAGSAWQQYGNAPYSPVSLYAATKQAFDDIATYYAEVRKVRVVECLLTDTYGTGDRRRKLVTQLCEAARTGEPLGMYGDGTQFIDLLHVDDAVAALMTAGVRAVRAPPGTRERWAVRPGHAITVRALVDRLAAVLGRDVPVRWGARPARPREMVIPWSAGEVLPGWAPTVTLEDGLREFR